MRRGKKATPKRCRRGGHSLGKEQIGTNRRHDGELVRFRRCSRAYCRYVQHKIGSQK